MLEEITWKAFALGLLVITGTWYVGIVMLFYRKDLIDWITSSGSNQNKPIAALNEKKEDVVVPPDILEDSAFTELESIVYDLRQDILEKAGNPANKNQLLFEMQLLLSTYSGIKKSAFRVAINNFIISQSKEMCGVEFSEEELEEAWKIL